MSTEYFRLNGVDTAFTDHPTEDTIFQPGALDSRVEVQLGKLYINLLSPAIGSSHPLAPAPYIRLCTRQPVALPEARYGSCIELASTDVIGVYGPREGLQIHGTLTVHEGYIELEGELRDYAEPPSLRIPVSLHKSFEPRPLLPPRTRYTLEQARRQPPAEVYELSVGTRLADDTFPQEILRYRNLEYLWFGGLGRLGVASLPDAFFELRQLRYLGVYMSKLRKLSPLIGQLQLLEELTVSYAQLTELPEELIHLGNLRRLDLSYNHCTRVPAQICSLPNLRQLNLQGNEWQELPDCLQQIQNVRVDYEHQSLYRDTSYKTKNTEPIDQRLYDLTKQEGARAQVQTLLETEVATEEFRGLLLTYARMATYLVPEKEPGNVPLGASKVGGQPDLPPELSYPTTPGGELYLFHAQINCAEVASFQDYLPREGMLYFFVQDEEYATPARVLYTADTTKLATYRPAAGDSYADDLPETEARAVRFEDAVSLPNTYQLHHYGRRRFPEYAGLIDQMEQTKYDELEDAMQALNEKHTGPTYDGGFRPRSTHGMNVHVFTQHESPEEQAAARYGGEAHEWLVLLNLESIQDFQFWDAGTLTYCIHKADLAIGEFSRVWASIESS